MAKETLSKLEVAKRQLVCAIRLYFNWGDVIAIHTLVAASRNVLCDLCEHHCVTHPILLNNLLARFVKPEHRRIIKDKSREPENFFKHADRDPEGSVTFESEMTDYMLLEAVEAYTALTSMCVPELAAYRGWWLLHHQSYLSEASAKDIRTLNGVVFDVSQRTKYFTEILIASAQLEEHVVPIDTPR